MPTLTAFDKLLKRYDYRLPQKLIAQTPAKPRDAARLLIYSKSDKKIKFDVFKNLGNYLPSSNFYKQNNKKNKSANYSKESNKSNSKKFVGGEPKNAVLVFNQTKVWPARFKIQKSTGGKAKILYIDHDKKYIKILSDRKLPVNTTISLSSGRYKTMYFIVSKQKENFYFLRPAFPMANLPKVLQKYGLTPLPPYIKNSPLTEIQRRKEYQSVFAKTGLSVAAPTASLHFTKKLMHDLQKQGIVTAFVQLDVNLGTFAPLREEQIKSGKLHREFYYIDKPTAKFLNKAKKEGRPIIAVGTTVVRTLESAAKNHQLTKLAGNTDLFIKENYKFKFVDGLITNFHVPKSSLLMLTSAFVGRDELLALYQRAINKNFRFFSFGDGMLILPMLK